MIKNKFMRVAASFAALSLVLAACGGAPATAPAPQVVEKVVTVAPQIVEKVVTVAPQVMEKVVTPTPAPSAEKVIDGVEPNAEVSLWTFFLSPTFDNYIKDTIKRFEATYPGVKVKWEDRQATFLDDYRKAIAAGNAPDVANLSTGWVLEFAQKGQLLSMSDSLPKGVVDTYFPGLFNQQTVDGKSYQLPWYQAVEINLVNSQVISAAGLKLEDMPKSFSDLPKVCQTIKDKTSNACLLRIDPSNILKTMVYEGGAEVIAKDGKSFTFANEKSAAWLKQYADMVKAGTVARDVLLADADRVGVERFSQGKAAWWGTGPQLIRVVRQNNPGLYGYLQVAPRQTGLSGKTGPSSMSMSVKKDTKFPKAAAALAVFFTNPKSQLEFAKTVSIYPATPASYDDAFFKTPGVAIEDSAKPLAKDIISKQEDIMPNIPKAKEVNDILKQALEKALFGGVDPMAALTEAQTKANEVIK